MAKFRMTILISSHLHKCFHEAGHIEVAYLHGATVRQAFIDKLGNGVAGIAHKPDLSSKKPVACGGYAAGLLLYEAGRLVDKLGAPMSEADFNAQAMNNARLDKYPFYITQAQVGGVYPGSPFQPGPNATWPPESDIPFIDHATNVIAPLLRPRFAIVEAIAAELVRGSLTQEEIEAIRFDFS
jgi:hypothetical protein